ncbi:MAG: DUF1624 domain-containing protein [Crocinitomicaceae bacterium]|nr:DUF1624 domain-containing protein [Crocinitomicaceae bacterium]
MRILEYYLLKTSDLHRHIHLKTKGKNTLINTLQHKISTTSVLNTSVTICIYMSTRMENLENIVFLPTILMSTITEIAPTPKVRLRFIDMARSVAILLMLEGHFVDDALDPIYRDPENSIYSTWLFIRGFTAPVFLTVTGLIFVYLLLKNREFSFRENLRVRKGFKRVVELFFWGFIVQYYAFHVLECIATGIFTILVIYGLYKLIKVIPLWFYFFSMGILAFSLFPTIDDMPNGMGLPENSWKWFLDLFCDFESRSTKVLFPTAPFVGYTMFGAMIGTLLHDFHGHVKKFYFPLAFTVIGSLLFFEPRLLLNLVDSFIDLFASSWNYKFAQLDWLFERLGMVLIELSILMFIDKYFGERMQKNNLFLKVGQNTLTIYILHMVLLYGSISGFGLNSLISYRKGSMAPLHPWYVALGALLFILFFIVFIKYLDVIKEKLGFILNPIKRLFNRLFFIR